MNTLSRIDALQSSPWPAPLGACLSALGDRVLRLQDEPAALLKRLYRLGDLEAGTCNRACLLCQTTSYQRLAYSSGCGVGRLRHGAVTMDVFPRQWALALAVVAPVAGVRAGTLLFFDVHGALQYQLQVPGDRGRHAFEELVCAMLHPEQTLLPRPQPAPVPQDTGRVNLAALEQGWSVLREPQDFTALLRRHGVRRLRAYRLVRDKFARPVSLDSVPALLTLGALRQAPLSLRCGNKGCVQRFEGVLPLPVWQGARLSLCRAGMRFNLSLREVASVWRVRKPSAEGVITTIELFDAAGERVLTISSGRSRGRLELPSWRALLADALLPPECVRLAGAGA